MSIIYSNQAQWPDNLVLDLMLAGHGVDINGIRCSRTWESGMDSVTVLGSEIIRRRGLQFEEPGSPEVMRLMEILNISFE
jgi:hypothetical protein